MSLNFWFAGELGRPPPSCGTGVSHLVHPPDEGVDAVLVVTSRTTVVVVKLLLLESAKRRGQLERVEEVVGSLEVGAASVDLVDEVLNADNPNASESLLDDGVVRDGDALLVDLAVTALVQELAHRLEVGVTVGDEGVDHAEHVHDGLVHAQEDAVVDLAQAEELQDLADLGGDADDTANADDEHNLGLGLAVVVAVELGLAAEADGVVLDLAVLLHVLLGRLEHNSALGAAGLEGLGLSRGAGGGQLLIALALLKDGLRDRVGHGDLK